MAKYKERISALSMRRKGISIIVIANKLKVSKGSVSKWCRDIELTKEQIEKLEKNKEIGYTRGQRMGAETNKKKRLEAIKNAESLGKEIIGKISSRELLLIATSLYWSEGAKSDRTSGFIFVNSDPEMVLIMKMFLVGVLNIPLKDIVCSIQINKIHEERISVVLSFWKKLLDLEDNQFRNPYYVRTNISKVYDNHNDYHGICRLIVRRGMNLKYKMLGLIKAIKSDILPV